MGQVEILGAPRAASDRILTGTALGLVAQLEDRFGERRRTILDARRSRLERLRAGERLGFLEATRAVRESEWRVTPPPPDLQDRRVEITGPCDRKMMINALNSGARVFMADMEDAQTPTWANVLDGQANVFDAVRHTLAYESDDGREYRLAPRVATLMVRPRGWHLGEKHVHVSGRPASGSLVDVGLFLAHNAAELLQRGSGPYLYLPKLEGHVEARLWNDVLGFAEQALGLPHGAVRVTVLIETISAAFEMDEILYELRDRIVALNAGRWDYLFSIIKQLGHDPAFRWPGRRQLTMTQPFMHSYTELLVRTCHHRGAHAIGGMAAYIPSRRDPELNERAMAQVRDDKIREAGQGFDGTWVAHPDLVPVATAVFDQVLGGRPNQKEVLREDVLVVPSDLLAVEVPGGTLDSADVRGNISIALRYLAAWLGGNGAVAIDNLMEDVATAEIARSQLWQWVSVGAALDDGGNIDAASFRELLSEAVTGLEGAVGPHLATAAELLESLVLADEFVAFLTLPAYERLP